MIEIRRLSGAAASALGYVPGIEAVFFEAAARPYPAGPEREAFRERWLTRYFEGPLDALFVAVTAAGDVAGYLVGTVENASLSDRFADLAYFKEDFAAACVEFPAHLHINVAPQHRSAGLGKRLIEEFARFAKAAGAPGMHVVTGHGMRNVDFYRQCGFHAHAQAIRGDRHLLFLARAL